MEVPFEIEERFLVHEADRAVYRRGDRVDIRQGYFPQHTPDTSARIRIRKHGGKTEAFLTVKTGRGRVRNEQESPIHDLELAHQLLNLCPLQLMKTRYVTDDGWEIDELHGPLEGIILAEKEIDDPDEVVVLPEWITRATNVTDSITNLHLAVLAHHRKDASDPRPILEHLVPNVPMIVLTGGPGSGKTTLMKASVERFGDQVHGVPEVASILIAQLGILPPSDLDSIDYLRFQRTLYRVQREFEALAQMQARRDGKQAVLLDRGTLDAMAYLPSADRYETFFGTSPDNDRARYAKVLVLDPAPAEVYEHIRDNNAARSETYAEATALFHRIRDAWGSLGMLEALGINHNLIKWGEKQDIALDLIKEVLDAQKTH